MDVLREDDALGYCNGSSEQRDELWSRARVSGACPAFLLPVFELCRAIHFGARLGKRFDIGVFRECWHDLVDAHELHSASSGCLLRLLHGGDDASDNLPFDVWSCAEVPKDTSEEASLVRDPRPQIRDPRPFTECFRALGDVAFEQVMGEEEWRRQWEYPLPELPGKDLDGRGAAASGRSDLVLDTNFFVDLLDELPPDGRISVLPCQRGAAAIKLGGANRRFQEALRTRGRSGKLIVPAAVLIETFGIVRVKGPDQHANADGVMKAIALKGSDWPLWEAFAFPALSLGVLDAYLWLHEEMALRVPDPDRWPDFTDAFVLAHGLLEECPVISGEWTRKEDWDEVKRRFPWLFLR